jgi:hypothetical protein
VQAARLEGVRDLHIDAGGLQPLDTAGCLGIRIAGADDDARHTCLDDPVGARRRRAPVGARLQRDVHRGAARSLARRVERYDLGVPARRLGRPFADDLAAGLDDRADRRLRVRPLTRLAREPDRALEAHASAWTSRR